MPFLSGRAGKVVFVIAIVLLLIMAFAADHATVLFSESEKWVAHTHEVQTTLARLRTRMYQAQAARLDYVLTGNDAALGLLESAKNGLAGTLDLLRSLTTDNQLQRERMRSLGPLLVERVGLLEEPSLSANPVRPIKHGRLPSPILVAKSRSA